MFNDRLKEGGSLNSHQHSALTSILDQSGAITPKTRLEINCCRSLEMEEDECGAA